MSLIGKSIGNYQIKAKLGEGGMGAVYLGEHPLIGKRVAVKVLLEELAAKEDIVQRFFTEAKVVTDIGHQNIVDIVDFGKVRLDPAAAETVYFVMEFLDGESLAARLRRTGLSVAETLHVMKQCCSALQASHSKGIVHRDLKPENIYLCTRGTDKNFVKILDFGIAKLTGDGGMGQSHKTRTGLVIGTPAYMSPEQCEGKGHIDHRSDVYSMGVVMYELLTGRVPFPGDGFGEILVAHLTKTPDPPSTLNPDIKPEIEALVLHAIEKDKNRRFQSMDEFVRALEDPAAHMQAYRPLPGYTPQPTGQQNLGATIVLGDGSGPVGATPTGQKTGQKGPTTGVGPRPTTLSGAAGEAEGDGAIAPRRSRMPVIVATAAVVVVAGVGGIFLLKNKGPEGDPKTAVVTPPPVDPKVEKDDDVKITVNTDPPGATVFRGDTAANEKGVTPLSFEVKKNAATFDIQVKLAGYKPGIRTISTEKDLAVLIPLEKIEEPKPVQPVAVATPEPAKDPKKEKKESDPTKPKREKKSTTKKEDTGAGGDDMKLLQPKF
jgi:serine/threonine-protein kinase